MATIGVGVQANELNITKPEVCGNGSLAASVEAVKSTDGNPWREARAELAASASGEVALEVADPSVKADFDHPAFQAWGTTFNELDLDALRMLTESERKEILDRAFLPDGELRFTRGRLTMNANDYSRAWYSCDEVDGDFDLKHFNIEHDKTNALVYVKWALARQPEMKFFVSPWSPPEWMKINHRYDVPRDESLYADPSDSKYPDEQGWPQRLATRDGMIQDPRYLTAYAGSTSCRSSARSPNAATALWTGRPRSTLRGSSSRTSARVPSNGTTGTWCCATPARAAGAGTRTRSCA